MNSCIKELYGKALDKAVPETWTTLTPEQVERVVEKFSELLVKKVLDEVTERAYYCGDRAWSNELDRSWIELEFGMGKLAEFKK